MVSNPKVIANVPILDIIYPFRIILEKRLSLKLCQRRFISTSNACFCTRKHKVNQMIYVTTAYMCRPNLGRWFFLNGMLDGLRKHETHIKDPCIWHRLVSIVRWENTGMVTVCQNDFMITKIFRPKTNTVIRKDVSPKLEIFQLAV